MADVDICRLRIAWEDSLKFRSGILTSILVSVLVFLATGCKTLRGPGPRVDWPEAQALPDAPPESLETESKGGLKLVEAEDGFVYAVGDLSDVEAGDTFEARYGGDWPFEQKPPVLGIGQVVRNYSGAALVQLLYERPDVEVDGAVVNPVEEVSNRAVGKGLAKVESVEKGTVKTSLGAKVGVKKGDVYGVLSAKSRLGTSQLSQQLRGMCVVSSVSAGGSECRPIAGNEHHPSATSLSPGQRLVFLTHRLQPSDSQSAIVELAGVEGGANSHRGDVKEVFEAYFDGLKNPTVDMKTLDESFDATRLDFYRIEQERKLADRPQILVGLSVDKRGGQRRLIANYTGLGSPWGPGMVAAPPKGGVDLGPASSPDPVKLKQLASTVWIAALVYRGQNARALLHLKQMLQDGDFAGPFRWHLRDQFAMRWGAFGYYREALWLVEQDEAIAINREARLNAFGTRVRLYDYIGESKTAVEEARRYFDEYKDQRPNILYRSALGMYAEMLMANGQTSKAVQKVYELEDMMAGTDNGREFRTTVAGVFWAMPKRVKEGDGLSDVEREVLDVLTKHESKRSDGEMAVIRFYQGVKYLRSGDPEQALIGFHESARLYNKLNEISGLARSKFVALLAELDRRKPQRAFETGREVEQLEKRMGDYEGVARIYRHLISLYTDPEFRKKPGEWMRSATGVLTTNIEQELTLGRVGKAADGMLTLGSFRMRYDQISKSKTTFKRAIQMAVSSTRFDLAAVGHLRLGLIAKKQGNKEAFKAQIEKARAFAELSGDPAIEAHIEKVVNSGSVSDMPTKVL